MKSVVLVSMMLGASLTASAIGHPHNLFSAHRKAKQFKSAEMGRTQQITKQTFAQCVSTVAPSVLSYSYAILRKKIL